jgi:hypothetical protein
VVEHLLCDKRVLPSPNIDFTTHFGSHEGPKIERVYKNIYNKLRENVCTIMFGMQGLDLPAFQLLMILDEVYDLAYLLPLHIKWNMILAIKHYKR